ncbi:MAG: glycerol-3-phosphate 1-O-acyltransferase PlsY [Oscillospiraceae bacterium]
MLLKITAIVFTIVISYLIGSINSAITVCKIAKHDDIRKYGSNNAGLTNVFRVYGKGPALATLLCDLAKGVIAVLICRLVVTYVFGVTFFDNTMFIGYIAGFAVMLGHIFPVFYGFHGGKGVLLAASTLLAIDPLTCLLSVSLFVIIVAITKYISIGSICAAVSYPIFTIITQMLRHTKGAVPDMIVAILIASCIIYMHRSNIKRLIAGTENKFSFKSKKEK